jgi:hypothetical protein
MTEDEAKTKWCPKFQVATSGGDVSSTFETDNRPREWIRDSGQEGPAAYVPTNKFNASCCCIGSACMAWRWSISPEESAAPDEYRHVSATINWGDGRSDEIKRGRREASGFCGLAGSARP